MRHIESAGIVVYHRSDYQPVYLLLKYSNGGHWDFAKGKIEAGETKETAALRELREETGMQVTLDPAFEYSFSYTYTQQDGRQARKTVYFFVGIANDMTVVLSSEHMQYAWVGYDDAVSMITFDTAKQLLMQVDTFIMHKQ
jgi:bis(5'-nucleosidyl)-tetraphosphatase